MPRKRSFKPSAAAREAVFDYCAEVAEYHAKMCLPDPYHEGSCAAEIAKEIRAAVKPIVLRELELSKALDEQEVPR